MPRPTLYVRDGCHLCEEAGVLLDEMLGSDGWDAIDIATDDDLLLRYAHRIPVLVVDWRRAGWSSSSHAPTSRRSSPTDDSGDPQAAPLQPALAVRDPPSRPAPRLAGQRAAPARPADRPLRERSSASRRRLWRRADLDGRDWTLADAGDRITWVNFWATSCEPCRTEMPAMQRIAEEYADELLDPRRELGRGGRLRRRLRGSVRRDVSDPARPWPRHLLRLGRDRWAARATISSASRERSSERSSGRWIRRGWSRSSTSSSRNRPRQRKRGAHCAPSSFSSERS